MRAAARSNASGARTTPEAPAPTPSRITAGATLANRAFLGGGAGIGCPRWLTVTEVASPSGAGAGVSATRVLSAASSRGRLRARHGVAPLVLQPAEPHALAEPLGPHEHRAGRRAGERLFGAADLVREHVRHGLVDRHGEAAAGALHESRRRARVRLGEAVVAVDGEHDAERRRHVVRAERQRLARRATRVDPLRQHDRQPQLERARELRRPRVDFSGDEVGGAVGEVARVRAAERAHRIFEARAVGVGEAGGGDLNHL